MTPLLSIILIGYNNKRFLAPCLGALKKQTLSVKGKTPLLAIWYIDNASSDDSVEWILRHHPEVKVLANRENLGYAAAANQGIRMTKSKYVMILNPDLILAPSYLKIALAKMGKNSRIAAIAGKILKYDFEKNTPTTLIDTTGLKAYRSRRVVDRGQGEEDVGQYDKEEEVFGVSGAGPIYRREALEDVKLPTHKKRQSGWEASIFSGARLEGGCREPELERVRAENGGSLVQPSTVYEYLDEDFFMYKEDVDLAWRLRLRGWKSLYAPSAVGYHGRGTGVVGRSTLGQIFRGRRTLNRFQKYYSYKNHYLLQVKNDILLNVLKHLPFIAFNELLRTLHTIFREPYLLKALAHAFIQLPRTLKKRKMIMARRTASNRELARWFNS